MSFPPALTMMYVERAGQQYTTSNGTEGHVFIDEGAPIAPVTGLCAKAQS